MSLCTDLTAATWITKDPAPWHKLATLGPSGLPAYARLLFLPDPTHLGHSENDAPERDDGRSETDLLRAASTHLTPHTTTPEDCYFLLWDGWGLHPSPPAGDQHRSGALSSKPVRLTRDAPPLPAPPAAFQPGVQPGVHPDARRPETGGLLVRLPERDYYLFRGTVTDLGDWGPDLPTTPSGWAPDPAFTWPADHAWCITRDVDPHYATIAASRPAITALLRDPHLDVLPTDPHQPQPYYL